MPPVSAARAKRLAEKAAKANSRKGKDSDVDSLRGSTMVDSAAASTIGDGADDVGVLKEMDRLKMATDRCVGFLDHSQQCC